MCVKCVVKSRINIYSNFFAELLPDRDKLLYVRWGPRNLYSIPSNMATPTSGRTLIKSSCQIKACAQYSYQRAFSSSPISASIGPESPKYIDVPKPAQSDFTPKPKLRGFLPIPRPLFTDIRDPKGRVIKEALERRVAESTIEPSPYRPKALSRHADRASYKARQAASRRRNLREGMVELLQRKERTDRVMAAKSRRKQDERQELVSRPEREDERLTRGSILSAMLQNGPLPDPNREERLEQKRRNFATVQQRRVEERRAALHTLYMNARNFITSEAQLDEHIEEQFGTREKPKAFGSESYIGTSYWDAGMPPTTAELLKGDYQEIDKPDRVVEVHKDLKLTQQRMRRMAEELTGGKM